jgi:N4-gp56 family major capsid protein
MATTVTPSDLQEIKYRREYWREYVRDSGFKPYMGGGSEGITSVIHTAFELTNNGKSLTIPLVDRLKNGGVRGNTRLSGNEEKLGKHTHSVAVQYARHAVELSKQDEHYDASNAREATRPLLKEWCASLLRDRIIDALGSVSFSETTNKVFYDDPVDVGDNVAASASEKNSWVTNHADRVLFGATTSNYSTTFATALGNVDSTDDKLNAEAISLMKRIAKDTSDPAIRPIRDQYVSDGREYFVMFCGSRTFRDLKTDDTIKNANRDARAREGDGMTRNPIFQDGDLMWDGVIIREIPEIPVLADAGDSSIDVGPVFLCGAQAVCVGWGQEPAFTMKKEDDYGFFTGVGIEELLGVNKVMRKHGTDGTFKDYGVVTGFFSATSD